MENYRTNNANDKLVMVCLTWPYKNSGLEIYFLNHKTNKVSINIWVNLAPMAEFCYFSLAGIKTNFQDGFFHVISKPEPKVHLSFGKIILFLCKMGNNLFSFLILTTVIDKQVKEELRHQNSVDKLWQMIKFDQTHLSHFQINFSIHNAYIQQQQM